MRYEKCGQGRAKLEAKDAVGNPAMQECDKMPQPRTAPEARAASSTALRHSIDHHSAPFQQEKGVRILVIPPYCTTQELDIHTYRSIG